MSRSAQTLALQIAVVACLVLWVYRDVPGSFFTGVDTFSLIETSRIESPRDLTRVLTRPLMDGTSFVELGRFYRPVTNLSFALDFALWGTNPLGYNLTSIALHLGVCLQLLLLLRRLTGLDSAAPWIGALLFSIHPVSIDVVHFTAHRQDTLASLLLLASLDLFLRWRVQARRSSAVLALSVAAALLALAAKETAAVLVGIIAVSSFVGCREPERRRRLATAAREVAPFFAVAVVWFAWRAYVLGGIGGYIVRPAAGLAPAPVLVGIGAAISFVVSFGVVGAEHALLAMNARTAALVLAAVTAVAALALVGLRRFFGTADETSPSPVAWVTLLAGALLPVPVYVAAGLFSQRLAYLPAACFCGLLGLLAATGARRAAAARRARRAAGGGGRRDELAAWGAIATAAIVALTLVAQSPLLLGSRAWRLRSEAGRRFFVAADRAVAAASPGARFVLHNVQGVTVGSRGRIRVSDRDLAASLAGPDASMNMLQYTENALTSWVHLRHPGLEPVFEVHAGGPRRWIWGAPRAAIPSGVGSVIVLYVVPHPPSPPSSAGAGAASPSM
jgi:hypothetical protein